MINFIDNDLIIELACMAIAEGEYDKAYFAAMSVENTLIKMRGIIWVVVFPWGQHWVFSDILN